MNIKSFVLMFLSICVCLCSCSRVERIMTVADIAYNRIHDVQLLYIIEAGQYIPFVVVTDNYNGNTLLLRKDVLERTKRISEYTSYYENSEIDEYLNGEYYEDLSDVWKYIASSNIEITSEDVLGTSKNKTITIERNIFLLSCNEIGISESVNISSEGKALEFFNNEKNRIVYSNGSTMSWWLRTPNTYYLSCTYVIGANNKIGYTNAYDKNGVRPAFCVEGDLPIELKAGIVEDRSVYVFSLEK